MNRFATLLGCLFIAIGFVRAADNSFQAWAPTPPMGWNSWDTFATTITEDQAKAETDYMAAHLASHGWKYMVVDIQWYEPGATGFDYRKDAKLCMDQYGRLQPAPNRFPSAAHEAGFKALADYVHTAGLKFGIHMMRGIAKQAVAANTPIFGSGYHAADIADVNSTCPWNPDMYGVDMSKPGAQDYYNAEFQQFADWGVDFVKIDDLSRPYHTAEIEAIRKAIDKTGRPMVFSTSPGETPVDQADHILAHANMWRISDDFWDNWKSLRHQVDLTEKWAPYLNKGGWPDCDMLPLGVVRQPKGGQKAPAPKPGQHPPGYTHFSPDEQRFLMTLWVMARSPLIFGGDLLKLDPDTLALITNDDVLAIDQHSAGNKPLFDHDGELAWIAEVPQSNDKYLAVFNLDDAKKGGSLPIPVDLSTVGFSGAVHIHDLWTGRDLSPTTGTFSPVVPSHGAQLYRLSPAP